MTSEEDAGTLTVMPYIPRDERFYAAFTPETPGELNYAITVLVMDYLRGKKHSYKTMNEIVGALECAKTEFYRRVMAPYEDEKCKQNGDVYASED